MVNVDVKKVLADARVAIEGAIWRRGEGETEGIRLYVGRHDPSTSTVTILETDAGDADGAISTLSGSFNVVHLTAELVALAIVKVHALGLHR